MVEFCFQTLYKNFFQLFLFILYFSKILPDISNIFANHEYGLQIAHYVCETQDVNLTIKIQNRLLNKVYSFKKVRNKNVSIIRAHI